TAHARSLRAEIHELAALQQRARTRAASGATVAVPGATAAVTVEVISPEVPETCPGDAVDGGRWTVDGVEPEVLGVESRPVGKPREASAGADGGLVPTGQDSTLGTQALPGGSGESPSPGAESGTQAAPETRPVVASPVPADAIAVPADILA